MIDPELLADLRRLVNIMKLPEWQRDLTAAVPDRLVKQIAEDFRRGPPPPGPTLPSVRVMGAGTVVDGDTAAPSRGWTEAKSIDTWKPDGLSIMDEMMDQQDAVDRAARVRELAEAAAVQRALKQSAEPKAQEPKARGDKKA
jgi:hypothetical protein